MANKPTVLATRRLPPDVEARLRRDYDARLNPTDEHYGTDALVAAAEGADALFILPTESMSAEVIERLPASVKIVATFSVGYEHIDRDAAKRRGLIFTYTPDVLNECTADMAMLLLMATARRAHECQNILRAGQWTGMAPTWMLGRRISGKRVGIVGMGRIGQVFARRARGFDMEVHYHNRSRLPAAQEQGAIYHGDPAEMLPLCDFLSKHCVSSQETRHWLNADRIARGRPHRRPPVGQARRGRARRVRGRAKNPGRADRAGQRVSDAPPGQRHRRDPQRHGLQMLRQSRRLFRRPRAPRPHRVSPDDRAAT